MITKNYVFAIKLQVLFTIVSSIIILFSLRYSHYAILRRTTQKPDKNLSSPSRTGSIDFDFENLSNP